MNRALALLPRAADWRQMRKQPRRDVVAGLTVAVVALPLALAFGIASGLGAGAGLVTAIVAGVLAAIFGGSNLQVSGPTGAMTVVLVPIVADHGADAVIVVGVLAGLILIALAAAGAGQALKYVPLPVVEGFTIGIAVIIALQQVPTILGVPATGGRVLVVALRAVGDFVRDPHWLPVLITAVVAGAILLAIRLRPGLPVSLLAVAAVTLTVATFDLDAATIGPIPRGLPAPSLPGLDAATVPVLLMPALAVAALAALESLLSASVADAMSVNERHDSDRELFGQGVANLGAAVFGGVPATAAIARTAVNVRSGARSRLGAITQSLALLLVVLLVAPWVGEIPLAALSGVLIATCVQMVEVSSVRALLHSTRGDAVVLITTTAATVLLDLIAAVILGIGIAGLIALRTMAGSARLESEALPAGDYSSQERALLDDHIVAYRLEGPLFFGAAHQFLLELTELSDVRVVILRMSRVVALDATGSSVLADTIRSLEARGITVMLSQVKPQHAEVLDRLGVYEELAHESHVFGSTPEAIAHAREHVQRQAHPLPQRAPQA